MNSRLGGTIILGAHLLLLGLLGWHFRHALNPDAVAYLRLASYYAEGTFDLAVSGYWGPLLSWLLAGLLKLGLPDLAAARVVMGFSALVFLGGCVAVFRAARLSAHWNFIGTVLAALAGAYWSVLFITPDLLLSGLLALAVSRMLASPALNGRADAVTGALWGLAYLTKAVALPVGALTLLAFGALDYFRDRPARAPVLRALLVRGTVFALVALPWVTVLSLKYQTFTFSTTARISHTLTGPPDMDRYHPFARQLHQPEAGRVTSWEEPSRMEYHPWSPFANRAYFQHQHKVLGQNSLTLVVLLTSLNLGWWIVFLAGMRALQAKVRAMKPRTTERPLTLPSPPLQGERVAELSAAASAKAEGQAREWSMGQPAIEPPQREPSSVFPLRLLVLPAVLVVVYLPFYITITQQRFFYAAFPFLFAAMIGWAEMQPFWLSIRLKRLLALACTALPLVMMLMVVKDSTRAAGDWGWTLAQRLQRAGEVGPVAGSGALPGGRAGLYVAFHLRQPWLGDDLNATPTTFKQAGARLIVVRRGMHWDDELTADAEFVSLDDVLFTSADEAKQCPLKVFARWADASRFSLTPRLQPGASDSREVFQPF